MKNIFALTKRNCLLFLRNKATVFFCFLSSIILVVLYFLFIAKLYMQDFNKVSGFALSNNQLNCAIYVQMIVGVLVLNSASLSVGMFGIMAGDFESRKTDALLLTKLTPTQLILSYLISAVAVSFSLNLIMWIISVIIIGCATSCWLGFGAFMAIVGALVVTTLISCCLMLLVTVLVKSTTAIGVINGILGTFLGFLCGIYMPYTNLGKGAEIVGSLFPFTHLTVWMKNIVLTDVFGQFGMPDNISQIMKQQWFSAGNVGFCSLDIPLWGMILYSLLFAAICLTISIILVRKRLHHKNSNHKISAPKLAKKK